MKKQALKNIAQIWRKKQILKAEIDTALGSYDLTDTAKDIFIFTSAQKICIASIMQNTYFHNKSFSTVKRAVLELKTKNLIATETDTVDKRIQWLIPIIQGD